MPYCSNCGNKVTDGMLFCPQCGNKLIIPKAGFTDIKDIKTYDYAIEEKAKKPEPVSSQGIKKSKLYRQWVEYAGLPAEEIPSTTKTPKDTSVREERNKQYSNALYMLLGGIILVLCVGLAFLIIKFY